MAARYAVPCLSWSGRREGVEDGRGSECNMRTCTIACSTGGEREGGREGGWGGGWKLTLT